MKSTLALFLATAFLVGCDRVGTTPNPTGSLGSGGSGGGGGSGGTGGGGGGGSGNNSLLDSTELNGPIPANALVGGLKRALVFYYPSDRELHILGSSDGAVGGTSDRETVWDISLHSDDTLYPKFISTHEPGFLDSIWIDTNTYKDAQIRMYTEVGSVEAVVQSKPGAIISVFVQAHSQLMLGTVPGTFPALLADSTTAKLVFPGGSTTPIGLTTFEVRLPAY